MKKIISGKLYDTETAELIGNFYKGGTSKSDFRYIEECIYKTKNGQYFIHIWGGANTEYATHYGNNRCEGEFMKLITVEEIGEWIEENSEYLSEDTIDEILKIIPFQEG